MTITIAIHGVRAPERAYVTWAASDASLVHDGDEPITVHIRNPLLGAGRIRFRQEPGQAFADELTLGLPAQGEVPFQIAGRFGSPSEQDGDVLLSVFDGAGDELASQRLMVRIRKDANDLTAGERDRFLSALVRLNTPDGTGQVPLFEIQNMHTSQADPEIHQRPAFLPWHRAYILDLERRLQAIDPSVSVPYWRFDRPAPRVFTRDFMGVPLASGVVDFSPTNPLINWVTRLSGSGNVRIRRANRGFVFDPTVGDFVPRDFDPTLERAISVRNGTNDTLNLGFDRATGQHVFALFRNMEGDPHGSAHVSFRGQISSPSTAPMDPLFFMLHSNVDRLWALWQWLAGRYDDEDRAAYPHQGSASTGNDVGASLGDYTHDTMWPWNGDVAPPRPNTAPGGTFPLPVPGARGVAPRAQPTVAETLDFQGQLRPGRDLGYGYADVEYEH